VPLEQNTSNTMIAHAPTFTAFPCPFLAKLHPYLFYLCPSLCPS